MPNKPKISAGASRTLNNLLEKAEAFAFLGSAHPEAQDPVGTAYRIDEYDGNESVQTVASYEWKTA